MNITKGKLEDSLVLMYIKAGSFAIIGAKMEKKPKLIAEIKTLTESCSQFLSVTVSSLIFYMKNYIIR